jgi:hypothetical protein
LARSLCRSISSVASVIGRVFVLQETLPARAC